MTQEGRRWVFEHADVCNQAFSDLYAARGPTPDSHNECPHLPMIQHTKRGRTRSVPGSYCERKPVKPVQSIQAASAPGRPRPPQKAEWAGTLDDQLDYLFYTPEQSPLQVAETCTGRPSPETETSNIVFESGTVQTSPPPPGEQPRRFVRNKRLSERLYDPAAAALNAFYYHAAANNLDQPSHHRSVQRASSSHEDGLRSHPRQPPPVSPQRVSKSPMRNEKTSTHVVGTQQWTLYKSRQEQLRTEVLKDSCSQEKAIRRSALEEPLHIRRPRPLRVSPRMRNKDIPFTGPLLESVILKNGMTSHSTLRLPCVAAGASSVRLSNCIIATYSEAEF